MKASEVNRLNSYLRKLIYGNNKLVEPKKINKIDWKKLCKFILKNVLTDSVYMNENEFIAYIEFQLIYLYISEFMRDKYPFLSKVTIKNMILKKGLHHVEGGKELRWKNIKEKNIDFQKCSDYQKQMINKYGYEILNDEDFSIWEAGRCIKFLTGQIKQKPGYFDYFLVSSNFSSDII